MTVMRYQSRAYKNKNKSLFLRSLNVLFVVHLPEVSHEMVYWLTPQKYGDYTCFGGIYLFL